MKSVSSRPVGAALTALLTGLVLLVSACGQKGPLTLPAAANAATDAAANAAASKAATAAASAPAR